MKTKFLTILMIALGLIFSMTAWAVKQAETTTTRLITVTGDADVKVAPDEVLLTLGVETHDKKLSVAKKENDERVKKVLALAKDYGIESKYIQTEHISIEPRYKDSYDKNELIGYVVRKTMVITLKDMTKFEDLLTGALEAEANYVHGVQFRTTELRKYKDQARALALKAAQQKATAMAAEVGQKVGQPHTIQEEQTGWWSWYNSGWGPGWGNSIAQNVVQETGGSSTISADSTTAPGQITVNARVTVSFELE